MTIYELNKLLSSEIKLKLISHFWECQCKNHDVSSLINKIGTTQSNVSKHIAVLLKENILNVRQIGKERFYSINAKFKKDWKNIIDPQVNSKANKKFKCNCNNVKC